MCREFSSIIRECNKKGIPLNINVLNNDLMKIENTKYVKDIWFVRKDGNELVLLHNNSSDNKIKYHEQYRFKSRNYKKLIRSIVRHDEYTFKYRGYKRVNLVDRLLYNK